MPDTVPPCARILSRTSLQKVLKDILTKTFTAPFPCQEQATARKHVEIVATRSREEKAKMETPSDQPKTHRA